MLNLKKTAVAVLVLSSSAAFAGTMGPVCSATNVTVPCEKDAWDFGVQALYLQPVHSGDMAYSGLNTTTGTTNTVSYVKHNPTYSWGFKLEGSYHFNTGNDFNVNWYHLGDQSKRRIYSDTFAFFDLDNTVAESSTVKPGWDAVNLEFGQHVDFGESTNIRFHAGAQFARVKNSITRSYSGLAGVANFNGASYTQSTFNGFGPRFGMDSSYDWNNGFSVYGNLGAAVLVGTGKLSQSFATINNGVNFSASKTVMVPELEGKLGAGYTYAMAQGDLTLDAGWMWVEYIGALQHNLFSVRTINDSNVGFQGPFLGLKWVGNVA